MQHCFSPIVRRKRTNGHNNDKNLARNYSTTGQNDRGIQLLQRASSLLQATPASASQKGNKALIEEGMGIILSRMNRDAEALTHFEAALAISVQLRGATSLSAAAIMVNSGMCCFLTGNLTTALVHYSAATAIYERHGVAGYAYSYALVLVNTGRVYAAQCKYKMALELFERSLAIRKKVLPPDHPSLGTLMLYISGANKALGRSSAAKEAAITATSVARRSQIACAGLECERRLREDGAPLDVCVNCRRTFYCGKACQTADWKAGHKKECKALIAGAAAAAAK